MKTTIIINQLTSCNRKGLNRLETAKELQVGASMIYRACRIHNFEFEKKGQSINKNHNFFENIDTEDKAYILGFTLADGCVSIEPKKKNGEIYSYSKRISFFNSIDDQDIILFIRDSISPSTTPIYYHNEKGAKIESLKLA